MDIFVCSRIVFVDGDDALFANSMFDRLRTPIDINDVDENYHTLYRELGSVEFADISQVEERVINANWGFDSIVEAMEMIDNIGSLSGVNSVHHVSSDGEEPSVLISFYNTNKNVHSTWNRKDISDWDDIGELFAEILEQF